MSEKDLRTRKNWLIVLVALSLLALIQNFAAISLGEPEIKFLKPFILGFASLITLTMNYLLYRCAYKKPGTKFLMYCIIVTPIAVLFTLSSAIFTSNQPIFPKHPFLLMMNIGSMGLSLYLYVLHFKMRTLNKRLKNPS